MAIRVHRNAESFSLAMLDYTTRGVTKVQLDVVRLVALEIFKGIIKRSPVDKGFYRASHNVSINAPDFTKPTGTQRPSTRLLGSLKHLKLGDTVFITSALPYSEVIELGQYGDGPKTVGGFSRQAPQGVYKVTTKSVMAKLRTGTLGVSTEER